MIELLVNLVNTVKDFGLERAFRRYYSLYRAQVTSNEDPEHRGRILVKIPSLFGDDPLPHFAEPKDFRGAGPGKGEFYPPDVDDWCFVEFEMGDNRFPVYSGGWHAESELDEDEFPHDGDTPTTKGTQNKYGHVFKFSEEDGKQKVYLSTPKGHFFILDDTDGEEAVHVIHSSGARLVLDEAGSFKFSAADGAFVALDAEQGSVMVNSAAGATVTLADDITVMDASGGSVMNVAEGLLQLTTDGDFVASSNTTTLNTGAFTVDTQGAKMTMGAGKLAMGTPACEVIDQLIQALNALLTAPTLVTTGVGPSGPMTPPASITLTQIMTLLTALKGSL